MSGLAFPYRRHTHSAPVPDAPALELCQVSVAYPGSRQLALEAVSFTVPQGVRVALIGPNGAGKSTLLKTIAGLLRPYAGHLTVYGQAPGRCHHRVAYLPQRSAVDWQFPMRVAALVCTGRYVHLGWFRRPRRTEMACALHALERLGLGALATRRLSALSGGERQRVLLARALVQEADLLLLDEPLNAVDVQTRKVIAEVLAALQGQGKTILVATHGLGRQDDGFDQVLSLEEGRFSGVSPPPVPPPAPAQEAPWIG
ncbi:MAG: ABC transporter ATP-binding protein [Candidatus Tectomicrobia bacterium]|uniref:ABC transporter ATP-binding protein n=1 Tax=Tectimicrobiota bacterium TaxID=2528274 RepID=A0A938B5Z6_UNCTE|nr:ABC transporter ATP-binding protein [Candidatus Tectomicrobia bacterium]